MDGVWLLIVTMIFLSGPQEGYQEHFERGPFLNENKCKMEAYEYARPAALHARDAIQVVTECKKVDIKA
jgi:hypothetical protein|tara:strand:+ start:182 stop:388 length:207 start_codon:yes stop_codon:yes gene_type:complete